MSRARRLDLVEAVTGTAVGIVRSRALVVWALPWWGPALSELEVQVGAALAGLTARDRIGSPDCSVPTMAELPAARWPQERLARHQPAAQAAKKAFLLRVADGALA